MKHPCDECVFRWLWADDEIGGNNRGCNHPIIYKTPSLCPAVMNYCIRINLKKVNE